MVKGKYTSYEALFADIQLIWDNCKNYNLPGSDIYKLACDMEKISKKLVAAVKETIGSNVPQKAARDEKPVTYKEARDEKPIKK